LEQPASQEVQEVSQRPEAAALAPQLGAKEPTEAEALHHHRQEAAAKSPEEEMDAQAEVDGR